MGFPILAAFAGVRTTLVSSAAFALPLLRGFCVHDFDSAAVPTVEKCTAAKVYAAALLASPESCEQFR